MRKYGDDKDYSLGGHSLGGSIALNTMKESKSIRDRVSKVHVFNPGITPLFNNSIKLSIAFPIRIPFPTKNTGRLLFLIISITL